jgi:hypothetical protein
MEFIMPLLPKIDHPTFKIKIPSTEKTHAFRPFLVKEEKILLMAKESKSTSDILSAIRQIVINCSVDEKFDIDKLALFDLEYIFLKLRSVSVDNVVKVAYRDIDEDKLYYFEVDLEEVEVKFPNKKVDNVVKISDNSGVVLRYPPASIYGDKDFLENSKEHMFDLIVRCIDSVYVNEEVHESKNIERKEIEDFLDSLDVKTFRGIQDYLTNTPKLYKEITYENSNGKKKKIVLKSLNDFFTWR